MGIPICRMSILGRHSAIPLMAGSVSLTVTVRSSALVGRAGLIACPLLVQCVVCCAALFCPGDLPVLVNSKRIERQAYSEKYRFMRFSLLRS